MKIGKIVSIVLFLSIPLSSCWYKGDDATAKEEYSLLVKYTLERKKGELTNLFAENIRTKLEAFDEQVRKLMDYVTGSFVSSVYKGGGAEYTIDNLKQKRFLFMAACELFTTDSKYFFSLLYCSADDYESKNIGIWNLMVQKCKSKDDAFVPYNSYKEWTYGSRYRGITLL